MFEQVGKARAPGAFIARSNIVGHTDRVRRRTVVLGKDDAQTVLEFVLLEGKIERSRQDRGRGHGNESQTCAQRESGPCRVEITGLGCMRCYA
jgi:hypothetical protein